MFIDRTGTALELALKVLAAIEDADAFLPGDTEMPGTATEIRDTLTSALSAHRQRRPQFDALGLHRRLMQEVAAAGSESEPARRMGITRQSLSDVRNDRREPGPAVLGYLHMTKCKTMYAPIDMAPGAH